MAYVGKAHDYTILKTEFPPLLGWFANFTILLDLGYQGFDKDYECRELLIPNKKPKGAELTTEQKEENKDISAERIWVEHSIGGMKRFRILSERLRVHDIDLYNEITGICAGLWNFYLSN
jgi:DDE superfamily endonuclease